MDSDAQRPGWRKLQINLDDLVDAFTEASWELSSFLDLEDGRIISISAEVRQELDALYEELPSDLPGDDERHLRLTTALEWRNLPAWMHEQVLQADQVERELGTRFIELPTTDSSEGYEYMQDFIRTVRSTRLQERLWDVIRGRGAFRRFKDALAEHPKEQERWFAFKASCTRERAVEWLTARGIQPTGPE